MTRWLFATFIAGLLVGGGIMYLLQRSVLATQLKAQIDHDQKVIDRRVADEQATTADVEKRLRQAQQDSLTLHTRLAVLQAANDDLAERITHVDFHPAPRPAPSHPDVVCPGHAVDSPEFLRLYNDAAHAARPEAAAGGAGGVHASGTSGHP